jgi:hypothetical protein
MMLLSINDTPEIRALFAWADVLEVETRYSIGRLDRGAAVPELLIGKGVDLMAIQAQAALF